MMSEWGLIGTSPALASVLCRAHKVAATSSTVLVTGETGTGKEVLARAIHGWSQRSAGPFVSVNCAAIPPALIASELFGHERGAFTGAVQRRRGRFELAAGGTLFLDEVGELPEETQVALLRVLQEHEFERIGGSTRIRADARIIAATNRDLQDSIARGTFRRDLYYRLDVFPIELPPLRERKGDLRPLVEHFVALHAGRIGKPIRSVDPHTLELFEAHGWPGNVRELQNVIERSLIVCESEVFAVDPNWQRGAPDTTSHAAPTSPEPARPSTPPSLRSALEGIQRDTIQQALESTNGIIGGPRGAAALLGLKRTTLHSRMKKLGIPQPRLVPPELGAHPLRAMTGSRIAATCLAMP